MSVGETEIDVTRNQVTKTLDSLEVEFPGIWDRFLMTKKRLYPDDKLKGLEREIETIMTAIWSVIMNMEFVTNIHAEDERVDFCHALFACIMHRANDETRNRFS